MMQSYPVEANMKVGILGAGVAGLSCAWLAKQNGFDPIVVERESYVGGLARSFQWHGFNCDFAAHRLFTKNEAILNEFLQLTPMIKHVRQSQIYFNHRQMRDPLDVIELASQTKRDGLRRIVISYLRRPRKSSPDSFKSFVVKRYGLELYEYFFRPYTEKLFGIAGEDIALSWAEAKVRLAGPFDRFSHSTKTKFNHFYYPRYGGYGAIASTLYEQVKSNVKLNSTVTKLEQGEENISAFHYIKDGEQKREPIDFLISTLPLTITSRMLNIDLQLSYRAVHAVYLLLNRPQLSPNHWTYFMDDDIAINRMVEFKNMSSVDAPASTTVVCAEVTTINNSVIERVIQDLIKVGMIQENEVLDTKIITEPYAYPVYSKNYETQVADTQLQFSKFRNLYAVGRAAEFKHREVDDNFASAIDAINKISTRNRNKQVAKLPFEKKMFQQLSVGKV